MRFLQHKSSPLTLGIDVSNYSMEALAITGSRDVVAYERLALEEGIMQNGSAAQKDMLHAKLDQMLAKLYMRAGNLRGALVVANIPEQHTYMHYFDVPVNVSGNDLSVYLQKEAGTVIPLEPRDMTATYMVLEKPEKSKVTKRVLFVATRKDVTQTILEALHAVGIGAPLLDIESMALMRSLLPARGPSDAVLILDGGSETSSMYIFEGRSLPVMSVAYPEGGTHATRRIAEKLGLSFDEAQKIKHAFGFLKAPRVPVESDTDETHLQQEQNTADGTIAETVSSVLHDWCQPLLAEFHKTIAFYEANHNKRVSGVTLSGGAALLPGIAAYLTAWMERPVRVGNPLQNLRNSEILGKDKPSILYATVIGLALHGADPSAVTIDFTHGAIIETKKSFQAHWQRRWTAIGIAILVAILIALAVYGISLFFNNETEYQYERADD